MSITPRLCTCHTPGGTLARRSVLAGAAALAATAATSPAVSAAPVAVSAPSAVDPAGGARATVTEWFDQTANLSAPSYVWAIGWGAASDAINRAPAGLTGLDRDIYAQAALAAAVHEVLTQVFPNSRAALDALLAVSFGRLPDGEAARAGQAEGVASATAELADRRARGYNSESLGEPFPTPAPGLGVWQPTPPDLAPASGFGFTKAAPFLIDDVARRRFGLPRPPGVGSAETIADLTELVAVGSVDSTARTPGQFEVAQFWFTPSAGFQWNQVLRSEVVSSTLPIGDLVGRVATYYRIAADTTVSILAQKYRYLWWRPVTALRVDDGNPRTPLVPDFLPTFESTPSTPEYPSGHVAFSASAEVTVAALFRPRPVTPVSITVAGVTRTYTRWSQVTQENIDARVWAGVHFRGTDTRSAEYGRAIGRAGLRAARFSLGAPS
ncbi:MAG: vanadium-dependent haloperoxidase [Dermatophilaceae bacterium]